jgi:1-acyl-sn-glycerol-3-phosphate acyltransferase
MKRMKKGESIFLAVEGEQTWNGRPMPVMPYTGKLVKGSGATLVNYLLEGAYLSAPRWALSTRRGKVYGRPAGVYGPEVLKDMSDEEVEKLIAKDLGFDTWEWQKTRPEGPLGYKCGKGGNAEGLERSVFTCPACGAFGTLTSRGDSISCSCGFKMRMSDTGFFDPPEPFETIVDWEDFDRTSLRDKETVLLSHEDDLFSDEDVSLFRIEDSHNDTEAAHGQLTLSCRDGSFILNIGDYSFDLKEISNMTMVLANRIVFSDASGYYELLAKKGSRTNLRKYVIARELLLKE